MKNPNGYRSGSGDWWNSVTDDGTERFAAELRALHAAANNPIARTVTRHAASQKPSVKIAESSWSDWLNGRNVPANFRAVHAVVTYLHSRVGRDSPYVARPDAWWQAAWETATAERRNDGGRGGRPRKRHPAAPHATGPRATSMRVREARPRLLGVHAAITIDGAPGELPLYVSRDLDVPLHHALTDATGHGGLILLVGDALTGKSRSLYQALYSAFPDRWLIQPTSAKACEDLVGEAASGTVVWLGSLQHHLDGPVPLQVGVVRDLIAAGLVLVATLWQREHSNRVAAPSFREPDRHANDRAVIALAQVIDVASAFSPAEQQRAAVLADEDPRLQRALAHSDAGVTQLLAAGPELIRRWDHAPSDQCYGKAVITAILDARRVGTHGFMTRKFLEAAAPAYLAPAEQAAAPADWLDQALDYATTKILGASAVLTPVDAGMGMIAGYVVAGYIYQHAVVRRRATPLPTAAWDAIVEHHHHNDTLRLADNASRRGHHKHAETLYRTAGDGPSAQCELAAFLAQHEAQDEALAILQPLVEAGDTTAASVMAEILLFLDRFDDATEMMHRLTEDGLARVSHVLLEMVGKSQRRAEIIRLLVRLAAAGNREAHLMIKLLDLGTRDLNAFDIELLDAATGSGQFFSEGRLREAEVLAENVISRQAPGPFLVTPFADLGRADLAVKSLAPFAATGHDTASLLLALLLARCQRWDDAITILEPHARRSERGVLLLAEIYAARGTAGDAIALLAEFVRAESDYRDLPLTHVSRQVNPTGGPGKASLRGISHTEQATTLLIDLLAEQELLDELRRYADAGNRYAGVQLVQFLASRGRIDELRDEVAAGTPRAAYRLTRHLDSAQPR